MQETRFGTKECAAIYFTADDQKQGKPVDVRIRIVQSLHPQSNLVRLLTALNVPFGDSFDLKVLVGVKCEVVIEGRNPMQLVEIKGVTKRIRKKLVLTVEQYHALLAELPYHIQVMVMIAMCLGLRISEIRALQWQDFDLKRRILTLARSIVGKYVWNGGKTGASEDEVALDSKLVSVLEDWQKRCVPTPEGWLFANADTRRPVHGDVIQKDYLRPAGEKVGLLGVGWHTFRHTYRTLIDDVGTPLGVQQRLMRHADIKTTMNTYGSAFEKSKRRANSRVAALVLPPAIKKQLKDRAKEVSLQNLKPETTAIQ